MARKPESGSQEAWIMALACSQLAVSPQASQTTSLNPHLLASKMRVLN